jgi:phosphoglucosamine mutase
MDQFEPVPQLLENVRFAAGQVPLEDAHVIAAIVQAEADLAGGGRLLIRKSGTEPLVRVMAEHEDAGLMQRAVASVVSAVEDAVKP